MRGVTFIKPLADQQRQRTLISMLIIFFLCQVSYQSKARQLPQNLVYGNKNLKFEKLYKLGDHTLLYFAHERRQKNRYLYLLNEANLVTDTLEVRGSDKILIRSDSSFSVKALGDMFEVSIRENRFHTKTAINVYYGFSTKIIDPLYFINDHLIGEMYHSEGDCVSYHYLNADSLELLTGAFTGKSIYGVNDKTNLYSLSIDDYEKVSGRSYNDLAIKPLFDRAKNCIDRTTLPYYGWFNSSLNDDIYIY